MNNRLILILPLILAVALFAISPSVPSAHAQLTGLVCITSSTTATSCPASPPSLGPFTVGQTFSVGVFISGSDAMGGFDIYVAVNTAILNPTSAALGPLIASPSLTSICVNGLATAGSCTANAANGPGVVEATTIESSGGNECGSISPCSGMAFTITYSVVGSTPSTPLSYPTALGCSTSSVSSPANVCVLVDDAFGTTLLENIQGATVTQAAVTHPTSTSVSCSPSSLVNNQAASCTATVTDTSSGPTTPTGSVSFTTNSTGTFNPTSASCTTAAGTTAGTATCSLSYTPTVTGHHLITSSYGGDSTHATSQGTFSLPVAPTPPHATTTSISCSPGSVTVNTASSCTATVTDQSTTPTTPTGTVTLATNSTGTFTPFSASCNLAAGASAGTASCSVAYQPSVIGHHLLTGSYSGDSTHSSSQGTFLLASTPLPLHITTTSIACTPASVTSGTATSCAATVTDTSSSPTTPSGTVSFTTNSTGTFSPVSASCTLAAGTTPGIASCSVSYTPTVTGHHLITGSYGGDSTHSKSSGTFNLAVSPVPLHGTTNSVACSPGSATVNTVRSCTVTVTDTSSSPTTPTGSVIFTTNSTGTFNPSAASCVLAAGTTAGTASCSVSYTPTVTGHHSITSSYAGDSTHSSSQGTFLIASTPAPLHTTTTSLACSPGSVTSGAATSCTATVTDTSLSPTTPTGSVSFTTNSTGTFTPTSASCTLAAGTTAGTASCSVSYTPTLVGHHLITGMYSSDSGHSISNGSFNLVTTVPPPHPTSTNIQCAPTSVQVSTPSTCTATVSDASTSGATTPAGSVSFTSNSTGTFNPVPASCTLSPGTAAGTATCQITYTPGATAVGHHLITGNYLSDSTHVASSGSFNLPVTAVPPSFDYSLSNNGPVSITQGSSGTATITATLAAGTAQAVTLSCVSATLPAGITCGNFTPNPVTPTVGGATTDFTINVAASVTAGPHTFDVTGSPLGTTSSHTTVTVTVTPPTKDDTTTVVSCSASVTVGLTGSCTLTVADTTNPANTPSGSVSLSSSDTAVGTVGASCALSGGSCTATVTGVASGSFTVTGTYGGDSSHNGSTGNSAAIDVSSAPLEDTSTSVACAASLSGGSSGSCTVTVVDATNPASIPSGSVSLSSSDTTVGTVDASCTLSGGSCTVTITGVASGSFTVTGTYGGDSVHNGSTGTSAAITVTAVVKDTTATGVVCVPSIIIVGQTSTCTATVTDLNSTSNTPTGTISFTASNPAAGTVGSSCSLVSSSCSVTFTGLAPGNVTVTGTYAGDLTHKSSSGTSGPISVTQVTGQKDFTISASPTSITVVGESPLCEGSSTLCDDEASTTITLTSINGFDGTVRLARSVSPRNGLLTVYCRQAATQLMPGATVKIRCFVEPEINPDSQTTFTVTITGRFGAPGSTGFLSHSVTITVTVTHAPTSSNDNGGDTLSSPLAASATLSLTGVATAVGGLVVTSGTHGDPRGDAHGRGHAHGPSGHHHSHSA